MLSGVSSSIIATLLTQQYVGRSVTVRLAHLDLALGTVIVDPVVVFGPAFMNGGWSIRENWPEEGKDGTLQGDRPLRGPHRLARPAAGMQTNVGAH